MADHPGHPGFGVLLTRLLNYRQTDIAWLATASDIPESELYSVADGAPPSVSHLEDLAAALGFHTADLFVIAGLPVPEPLQPCEPLAGSGLARVLHITMVLPEDQRIHIRATVEQLPHLPHVRPADPPRTPYLRYYLQDGGFGAMLVAMLCANRNLSLPAAARTSALLTQGRMYLSASTYHSIATGSAPLRPAWLAGFATTLGIPIGDLAAITGTVLSEPTPPDNPLAAEAAELLWDCQRLTASQIEHVRAEAEAMLVAVPHDASNDDWHRVLHHHGTWWGTPRP
ncbi:hypothetical protein [Actinoallomurus sp. CA-150999]|uniref:hypothetical protein n=1 Tax=Actinoallomurus sp. CA-150999 TaxID=3239887 RepID=UPI003D8B6DDD